MREIKFRAWDGEQYVHDKPTLNHHNEKVTRLITMDGDVRTCIWHKKGISLNWYGHYILEQFTGIKDTNEKDIYEGDVLEYTENGNKTKVFYDPYSASYSPNFSEWTKDKIKVIGNIHQNPELCQ